MAKASILIVEDFESNRELMVTGLRMRGYEVDGAADVREAVAAVASKDYDVVVMDYTLPDGHGDDATRLILETMAAEGRPAPHVLGWTASNDALLMKAWKTVGVLDVRIKADEGCEIDWLVDRLEGRPLVARAA